MDYGIKLLLIFVCLILCLGGCMDQSDYKDRYNSQGDRDLPSKATPMPTGGTQTGSNGAITTGGSISTGGAISSGGSMTGDSAFGEDDKVSPGAVDISDGMATPVQKEEYSKVSLYMEEMYGIIKNEYSRWVEETVYEDYRYFGPIYEYYHGVGEEKCENIREDEMEKILKGIDEYVTAMEEFAKKYDIELPSKD